MRKTSILIFNVIFAVLCIAAIFLYFLSPVLRVDASYHLTDEQIDKMLGDDIDFKTQSGEGVDVNFSLDFDSVHMLLAVADGDTQKTVNRIVDSNLDNIVAQISASVSVIAKEVVQSVATKTVTEELKTQVKDYLSSSSEEESPVTDEQVQELLQSSGVTEEYISEQVETLVDEIYKPEATVNEICDKTVDIAKDAFEKLQSSEKAEFADLQFTAADEQSVREAITEILNEVADENGNINAEEYVDTLILEMMKELNSSENSESGSAAIVPLAASTLEGRESGESASSSEELKAEIKQYILSVIPLEQLNTSFLIGFIAIAAILCISLLSWAYLLLKILVKFFTKNHSVKLKCPIILGWLPFLIFYALPTLAMIILPHFVELPAITLSFFSSGIFAFAAAVIMIALWIPYRLLRKKAD